MVTIIDYGMGNIFSVSNALRALGADVVISRDPEDIRNADRLILPGVGAFPDGMRNLQESGLAHLLAEEVVGRGKPLLGICLGMQLLASVGEEHGRTEGLGWIPGIVRRFTVDAQGYRVPHIGWNEVTAVGESRLLRGVTRPVFYFVHSYHFIPGDARWIEGACEYGGSFVGIVGRENVFGVQFHPEKSQRDGLKVLENFLQFSR